MWIRYGYDPRLRPKSRWFQRLPIVRVSKKPDQQGEATEQLTLK